MADLFSAEWMNGFLDAWNGEPDLADALAKIGFNSTIGYGFTDDDTAKGFITISEGRATAAGTYAGEPLDWDLRATPEHWRAWMKKPPGMMGLGLAYTSGKLKFRTGDYAGMIKDPRMAGPFINSFSVMGRV